MTIGERIGGTGEAPPALRVLMSAYACEPNRGSEPGIGWHWATRLARTGHHVCVLTRANNRAPIEGELEASPVPNLRVVYYDLPEWVRRWKKRAGLSRLYYLLWQWGAYGVARRLCREARFDLVHHITFGVFRLPSFMAFLGLPFVFGPVGGGESAPRSLRKTFPLRGYIIDLFRDIANWLVRVDPLMAAVFRRSAATLCKTDETLHRIPSRFHDKCLVQVELGTEGRPAAPRPASREEDGFRVLYVGRLVYWKGLHLGLAAFARLLEHQPRATLTVIGSGPEEAWLRDSAQRLDIGHAVNWIRSLDQAAVMGAYARHDVLLFPSLHDSSGNVVLEALSSGLPVVCLDAGGPALLVDSSCGFKVRPVAPQQVVEDLSLSLATLADDRRLVWSMGEAASRRAREHFSWEQQVARMERVYQSVRAGSHCGSHRLKSSGDTSLFTESGA